MTPEERREAMRALAADLDRVDLEVYRAYARDPLEPVLGEGDPRCRVCFFGRDPGRHEVQHQAPFVGAGGQKVRQVLHQLLHGEPLPSFEASLEVGRTAFWANTVPYKPIGNKVWPAKTRKAFRPLVQDLLVHGWQGEDILVLGRVAFFWFAGDRETKRRLQAHWDLGDARYERSIPVDLVAPDGTERTVRLHPLPHPSPLNAVWAPRFPGLLEARLRAVGFGPGEWQR